MAQSQMYWAFVVVPTKLFQHPTLQSGGSGRGSRGDGRGDNLSNFYISFTSNSHFLGQGKGSDRHSLIMSAAMGIPL